MCNKLVLMVLAVSLDSSVCMHILAGKCSQDMFMDSL